MFELFTVFSGEYLLHPILHPVFQRFFPGRTFKSLNKMTDISKTAGIGYIENGRIGRSQQFHGVPDADVIDIIHAGPAEGLLKKTAEILQPIFYIENSTTDATPMRKPTS